MATQFPLSDDVIRYLASKVISPRNADTFSTIVDSDPASLAAKAAAGEFKRGSYYDDIGEATRIDGVFTTNQPYNLKSVTPQWKFDALATAQRNQTTRNPSGAFINQVIKPMRHNEALGRPGYFVTHNIGKTGLNPNSQYQVVRVDQAPQQLVEAYPDLAMGDWTKDDVFRSPQSAEYAKREGAVDASGVPIRDYTKQTLNQLGRTPYVMQYTPVGRPHRIMSVTTPQSVWDAIDNSLNQKAYINAPRKTIGYNYQPVAEEVDITYKGQDIDPANALWGQGYSSYTDSAIGDMYETRQEWKKRLDAEAEARRLKNPIITQTKGNQVVVMPRDSEAVQTGITHRNELLREIYEKDMALREQVGLASIEDEFHIPKMSFDDWVLLRKGEGKSDRYYTVKKQQKEAEMELAKRDRASLNAYYKNQPSHITKSGEFTINLTDTPLTVKEFNQKLQGDDATARLAATVGSYENLPQDLKVGSGNSDHAIGRWYPVGVTDEVDEVGHKTGKTKTVWGLYPLKHLSILDRLGRQQNLQPLQLNQDLLIDNLLAQGFEPRLAAEIANRVEQARELEYKFKAGEIGSNEILNSQKVISVGGSNKPRSRMIAGPVSDPVKQANANAHVTELILKSRALPGTKTLVSLGLDEMPYTSDLVSVTKDLADINKAIKYAQGRGSQGVDSVWLKGTEDEVVDVDPLLDMYYRLGTNKAGVTGDIMRKADALRGGEMGQYGKPQYVPDSPLEGAAYALEMGEQGFPVDIPITDEMRKNTSWLKAFDPASNHLDKNKYAYNGVVLTVLSLPKEKQAKAARSILQRNANILDDETRFELGKIGGLVQEKRLPSQVVPEIIRQEPSFEIGGSYRPLTDREVFSPTHGGLLPKPTTTYQYGDPVKGQQLEAENTERRIKATKEYERLRQEEMRLAAEEAIPDTRFTPSEATPAQYITSDDELENLDLWVKSPDVPRNLKASQYLEGDWKHISKVMPRTKSGKINTKALQKVIYSNANGIQVTLLDEILANAAIIDSNKQYRYLTPDLGRIESSVLADGTRKEYELVTDGKEIGFVGGASNKEDDDAIWLTKKEEDLQNKKINLVKHQVALQKAKETGKPAPRMLMANMSIDDYEQYVKGYETQVANLEQEILNTKQQPLYNDPNSDWYYPDALDVLVKKKKALDDYNVLIQDYYASGNKPTNMMVKKNLSIDDLETNTSSLRKEIQALQKVLDFAYRSESIPKIESSILRKVKPAAEEILPDEAFIQSQYESYYPPQESTAVTVSSQDVPVSPVERNPQLKTDAIKRERLDRMLRRQQLSQANQPQSKSKSKSKSKQPQQPQQPNLYPVVDPVIQTYTDLTAPMNPRQYVSIPQTKTFVSSINPMYEALNTGKVQGVVPDFSPASYVSVPIPSRVSLPMNVSRPTYSPVSRTSPQPSQTPTSLFDDSSNVPMNPPPYVPLITDDEILAYVASNNVPQTEVPFDYSGSDSWDQLDDAVIDIVHQPAKASAKTKSTPLLIENEFVAPESTARETEQVIEEAVEQMKDVARRGGNPYLIPALAGGGLMALVALNSRLQAQKQEEEKRRREEMYRLMF